MELRFWEEYKKESIWDDHTTSARIASDLFESEGQV
jgi:adenine-specific DNA-methyltransferase